MTQQYIVGEFSSLLAELQPAPGTRVAAVDDLRREVESSSLDELPLLAHRALSMTDGMCWAALEDGNVTGFSRCAKTACRLGDFTENAGLLP